MAHINGLGSGLNGLTDTKSTLVKATEPTVQAAESRKIVRTNGPAAADQASLSLAGGLAAQAGPEVRVDKVEALQKAIAGGTYHVSASDVAGKIVDSLLGS